MNDQIIIAIIAGLCGFLGTYYTASLKEKSDKDKNKIDRELAYANNMPGLLDKLDAVIDERDALKNQVFELKQDIAAQNILIKNQQSTINSLNKKINRLLNETQQRDHNERVGINEKNTK